jgi:chromosome partitioning protein
MALVSQKGGVGKTSLAIHTALAAEERGERVVLIDCDPQQSLLAWAKQRERKTPVVIAASGYELDKALAAAKHDRMTLAIIDTAPHSAPDAAKAVGFAGLVVVPIRPSCLDLAAVGVTTAMVQALGSKAVFVLSACPVRALEVEETREALKGYSLPVFTGQITDRRAFARALVDGRGVTEFEPNGKAAEEIRALWRWLDKRGKTKWNA